MSIESALSPQSHHLSIALHTDDYLMFKCADCGDMTLNEYLGTTYDRGVCCIRITCNSCHLSSVYKLPWPQWVGLPITPELDESSLFRTTRDKARPSDTGDAERSA